MGWSQNDVDVFSSWQKQWQQQQRHLLVLFK